MIVRSLNEEGIERFVQFLVRCSTERGTAPPTDLLDDPQFTMAVVPTIEVNERAFINQLEIGRYLNERFGERAARQHERNRGIWSWLGLFYFESICPRTRFGHWKPGETARWVLEPHNYQKYYRHLLAGPFRIVLRHQSDLDNAMALLCNPPGVRGDIVEQLSAYQELITNAGLVCAATRLYYDTESRRFKRGAGGKGHGSPRRLQKVISQFDLTYDLYSMSADAILELLPKEFDRFRR